MNMYRLIPSLDGIRHMLVCAQHNITYVQTHSTTWDILNRKDLVTLLWIFIALCMSYVYYVCMLYNSSKTSDRRS